MAVLKPQGEGQRRFEKHEFTPKPERRWARICLLCDWTEEQPWHLPPKGYMQTATGKLVQEPSFHATPECRGQRAEQSLFFEGWWWWICMTCGAIWQGVQSPRRYMRDLWRDR